MMIWHLGTPDGTDQLTTDSGEPRSFLSSPTLFDMLMDTLAESIVPERLDETGCNRLTDVIMFTCDMNMQKADKAQLDSVLR